MKRLAALTLALCLSVLSWQVVSAESNLVGNYSTTSKLGASILPASPERRAQRENYKLAKKQLAAGQRTAFRKTLASLEPYPAYPYLKYSELRRSLSSRKKSEVDDVIQRYDHLAISSRLRAKWLLHLGKRKRWSDFLEYYDEEVANTSLRCYKLRAEIQQGNADTAMPAVADIWLAGKSRPKTCDPLFKQWIDAGELTADLKWQRFRLAMKKSNTQLARYLQGLMSVDDKKYAEQFLQYHRKPALIKKRGALKSDNARHRDIAIHAVYRLARKNKESAANRLDQLHRAMHFPMSDLAWVQKSIAFKMLSKPDRSYLKWMQRQLRDEVHEDVAVYAARIALVYEDWDLVLDAVEKMPAKLQGTERWSYWQAKAAFMKNPALDDNWKSTAFSELAGKRDFYGFLSAHLLKREFDFNDHPLNIDESVKEKVAALPGLQLAMELFALNENTSGRREWRHTLLQLPNEEIVAAAHFAKAQGLSNQMITTAIIARSWDELELRFPLSYHKYLQRGAKFAGIDLAWAYAVARQESAMNPDAVSHAGAKGLMQLMPATARETVKRSAVPAKHTKLLNEKHNALIGSAHLGELSRHYKGSRVLSSAAYNAGKHRVTAWLKRNDQSQDMDVWVETIPYKETRNYVQNVLMFAAIYARRLGEEPEFIRQNEWLVGP